MMEAVRIIKKNIYPTQTINYFSRTWEVKHKVLNVTRAFVKTTQKLSKEFKLFLSR